MDIIDVVAGFFLMVICVTVATVRKAIRAVTKASVAIVTNLSNKLRRK